MPPPEGVVEQEPRKLSAFTVFRLVDGKIVEEHELLDELGMMRQLGMELQPGAAD